ncbi:MAG TPA: CRISPR-associated endonuclease Cas1 [Dissulfurispiraceae bacterium]|nr:CRISPR-associated endonuclease Cas1 [Dissulfurispiraceae bacterium]
MNKALYIHQARGLEVRRDGPSLIIREPDKADRRIPARIISNVVVIGNVRMDAGMVALCAEQGVPITFICSRGKAIAVALPYEYRLPRHHPKQRIFMESESNRRKFELWLRANVRRLTMVCVHNLTGRHQEAYSERPEHEPRAVDYAYLVKQLERTWPAQSRIVREVIDQLFQETIMSVLLANGLDPHVGIIHRYRNLGLVEDLRVFFRPEADYQAVCFFQEVENHEWFDLDDDGYQLRRNGLFAIVERFESRRESIVYVAERLTEQMLRMFGSSVG